MTRTRSVLPILMAGLLCVVIGWSGVAQPTRVIIVPPSESLQKAVDTAPEGAVIQLQAREYTENLVIEKSLTLRGFSDAPEFVVLAPKSGGPVVTLRGTDEIQVVLEGFTIERAKGYLPDGVYVLGSGSVTLRNLVVRECWGSGVSVHGEGRVVIDHCALVDNHVYGLTVANPDVDVTGSENRFDGNGVPLGRYAPPELRTPAAEQIDRETVRVPEDYATIQAAVDAVVPGGAVEIGSGEFVGGVCLWKDVTLRGQGRAETILAAAKKRIGLSVLQSAGTVRIEKLTVSSFGQTSIEIGSEVHLSNAAFLGHRGVHLGSYLSVVSGGQLIAVNCRFAEFGGIAIFTDEATMLRLADCVFEESRAGLKVNGSTRITECRFEGIRDMGVFVERGEFEIERTSFSDAPYGLGIGEAQGAVRECTFEELSKTCLLADAASDVEVTDCSFDGAEHAVRAYGESAITLKGCTITSAADAAVLIHELAAARLVGCEVAGNPGIGVRVIEHGVCTIVDSSIHGNGFDTQTTEWTETIGVSGVHVTPNASLRMENVTVTGNTDAGLLCVPGVESRPYSLVEPEGGPASVVLIDCRFEANGGLGLGGRDSQDITVRGCTFTGETFGVVLGGWVSAVVEESTFAGNDVGIFGVGFAKLAVQSSYLGASRRAGLMLGGYAEAIVEESVFTENYVGILLMEATVLMLSDSSVVRSLTYGLSLGCAECWPTGMDYDPSMDFAGLVAGFGNRIPDVGETDANWGGAFCPDDVGRELLTPGEDQV